MNTSILTSCSIAIAVTGAIATARAAEPNGNDAPRQHRFRHHRMAEKLTAIGATDAQKEQIRAIMRESRPTMQPLVKQLMQERRALRDLTHTSPVNESAIRAQAARVAQLQAELAVKRAYASERVRALLTPEQAAKLKEITAKRDARREEWMNRRRNADGA